MNSDFDLNLFKQGMLYQLSPLESDRLAGRTLQYLDKDASKDLNIREIKAMAREIYLGMGIKINVVSNDEAMDYLKVLTSKDTLKLDESDFKALVRDYYVNEKNEGSMDMQVRFPEIIEFDPDNNFRDIPSDTLIKELTQIITNRYGKAFTDEQLSMCEELFKEQGFSLDNRLDYKLIFEIFKKIYERTGILEKGESVMIDDLKRLFDMISLQKDQKISYTDFVIFYLRSLVGS